MEDSVKSYGSSYNIVDHIEAHIIFYPKAQIKKCTASRKALKKSPLLEAVHHIMFSSFYFTMISSVNSQPPSIVVLPCTRT